MKKLPVYEILSFIFGLLIGVPIVMFGIDQFKDNVTTLLSIVLGGLISTCALAVILIISRRWILKRVFNKTEISLEELVDPASQCVSDLIDRDREGARKNATSVMQIIFARIAWFSSIGWITGTAMALLVGFAGLIGSALLFEQNKLFRAQNKLFEKQNRFFQTQNAYFREQNEEVVGQFEAAERTKLLRTLYETKELSLIEKQLGVEPEPLANARLRTEALNAFVALETKRLKKVDQFQVNLSGAYMGGVSKESVEQARKFLRGADLRGTFLEEADLREADLREANLRGAQLSGADLRGANLRGAQLSGADLRLANLRGANLVNSELIDADLDSAQLREAELSGANLSGANLRGAEINQAFVHGGWIVENFMRVRGFEPSEWTEVELVNRPMERIGTHKIVGISTEQVDPTEQTQSQKP